MTTSIQSEGLHAKKPLLIVESPAKAKTIAKYLGDRYMVTASVGHIADIPERPNAVDVANAFATSYVPTERGSEVLRNIGTLLEKASKLILATDADREGELIAAHLVEFLKPRIPVERIEFRSVTRPAIEEALVNPRQIDGQLVEAAKARRVLDHLYGFQVSPVLWKTVRGKLSAGRVQSPAMRLVVEREVERLKYVSTVFYGLQGVSATSPEFSFRLVTLADRRIAIARDFDAAGAPVRDVVALQADMAGRLERVLTDRSASLTVTAVQKKAYRRSPQPPFTMSTLYQAAGNRLGMSTLQARTVSQQLFDAGHISYPRTDCAALSAEKLTEVRQAIAEVFGSDLISEAVRFAQSSDKKNIQGAHEAIHPTCILEREPGGLDARQLALYQLIWQRTLASEMVDVSGTTLSITLHTLVIDEVPTDCTFSATGTTITCPGFRTVYGVDEQDRSLPDVAVGDVVPVASFSVVEHKTSPPPRFTEAALVKTLEELGIGRPSTYASIIGKLRERYVWSRKGDRALIPTITAFAVHRILAGYFCDLVNYDFTRRMEEGLDLIAGGDLLRAELLARFFHGAGEDWKGLRSLVTGIVNSIDPSQLYALDFGRHPVTKEAILVKPGRLYKGGFSPYIQCGTVVQSISDHTALDELTIEALIARLVAKPVALGELNGVPVFVKQRGGGYYFQWGRADQLPAGATKPRCAGLLGGINPETVTLADAVKSLSLPRLLGVDAVTGADITACLGPYGPYIQRGVDKRSLKDEQALFTVTAEEAVALLAEPKRHRRRSLSFRQDISN